MDILGMHIDPHVLTSLFLVVMALLIENIDLCRINLPNSAGDSDAMIGLVVLLRLFLLRRLYTTWPFNDKFRIHIVLLIPVNKIHMPNIYQQLDL